MPSSLSAIAHMKDPPLKSFLPDTEVDVEFENEWENVSDWNEDDEEACKEENMLCFGEPGDGTGAMSVSP
jgi:CTD kinase subunit gamma